MDHNYFNLFRKKMINNYCQKYMMHKECFTSHASLKHVFFINGSIVFSIL